MLVKKYGNRRLYDTTQSRYVTHEEVADHVRNGGDVRVVDAKTGHDLTQVTLAQIILEGRGAARLLPVPLLKQLIRMRDDALAEFFGRYVAWALDVYLRVRSGARLLPFDPFAGLALAPDLLGRVFGRGGGEVMPPPPIPDEDAADAKQDADIADLRRELEELKRAMNGQRSEGSAESSRRGRAARRPGG